MCASWQSATLPICGIADALYIDSLPSAPEHEEVPQPHGGIDAVRSLVVRVAHALAVAVRRRIHAVEHARPLHEGLVCRPHAVQRHVGQIREPALSALHHLGVLLRDRLEHGLATMRTDWSVFVPLSPSYAVRALYTAIWVTGAPLTSTRRTSPSYRAYVALARRAPLPAP